MNNFQIYFLPAYGLYNWLFFIDFSISRSLFSRGNVINDGNISIHEQLYYNILFSKLFSDIGPEGEYYPDPGQEIKDYKLAKLMQVKTIKPQNIWNYWKVEENFRGEDIEEHFP